MAASQEEVERAPSGESTVDVRHYWSIIKKRRWLIAATVVIVTAAAVAWSMRRPKVYQASATVIVDPQAPKVLGAQDQVVELGSGNNFWINSDYYTTQFRILTSRTLALKVARKYNLHRDSRLVPALAPGQTEERQIERVADGLANSILVSRSKDSRVLSITVQSLDPTLCADLANYVAQVYIEQNLEVKLDATRGARRWVAEQLDSSRTELAGSETALYDFRRENNILSVALEDRQNMISKALEEFSNALTDTKRRRIDLETRRKAIAAIIEVDPASVPSSYVSTAPTVDEIRKTYLEERRKLASLEERYGHKHPEVVTQRIRVATTHDDLKAQARNMLAAMDAEVKALRDSEGRYIAEVERLTGEALDVNKKEIDYKKLARRAANAEQVYGLLLKRYTESGLQEQDQANNIRLLDAARVPGGPIEPNPRRAATFGFGLAVLLGLALAFGVEFLDRSVKSQEDIETTVGLPFLGFVPSVQEMLKPGETRDTYVMKHPNSTVAECCRVVRTNILFCSPDKPLRTMVVTSSNPLEGKTMTVVNLGVVMAQSGHRTLLVDTDMRRPRLHKALQASNENGVSRIILGETEIEDAVKSTDMPNLFLLPCGPIPPNPAELLQTEKFAALVRRLSERFDRVIFDSPPALALTDAAVLSRVVDGAVIVVRAGRTTRDAVIRTKQLIQSVNANIVGAVLNDVNLKNPHYAGYYHYYHYKYTESSGKTGTEAKNA